jgi:hypothetical protein
MTVMEVVKFTVGNVLLPFCVGFAFWALWCLVYKWVTSSSEEPEDE